MNIYVAGALNDVAIKYIKNIHNMCVYANEIKKLGHCVFIPCLDFLMGVMFGDWEYDDYASNNLEWLKVSDAVFICPGYEKSKGTKKEIEVAEELGIPVYYKLEDVGVNDEENL